MSVDFQYCTVRRTPVRLKLGALGYESLPHSTGYVYFTSDIVRVSTVQLSLPVSRGLLGTSKPMDLGLLGE